MACGLGFAAPLVKKHNKFCRPMCRMSSDNLPHACVEVLVAHELGVMELMEVLPGMSVVVVVECVAYVVVVVGKRDGVPTASA